jgi:outer membrane lipoprotein-sorting protein
MRSERRAFLLCTFLSLVAFTASADDAPAREPLEGAKLDALLGDITKARASVQTMRAAFTQERKITLLATTVKSTGEMIYVAPDRLRWDLAAPDDIVYFIGPEGLSYKTKSSSATVPAQGASVAKALADVRALLGGDLSTLKERYTLSGSRSAADVEINGTAKDPKASVRGFKMVLDKGLVNPVRAELLEGKSDRIDLRFNNVVTNEKIDPAKMRP